MEKEFSFLEMLIYCFRKWIIIVICAVLGLGGYFIYTLSTLTSDNAMTVEGTVSISGIGQFYPDVPASGLAEVKGVYDLQVKRALEVMTTSGLKNRTYQNIKEDYAKHYEKLTETQRERQFIDAIVVSQSSYYITVQYNYVKRSDEDTAFCKNLVSAYMEEAEKATIADDSRFLGKINLTGPDANMSALTTSERSQSIFVSIAIGLLCGALVGFAITVIIYFADGRIKSFGDIAAITGNRLLGIGGLSDFDSIGPKTDAIMTQRNIKTLLLFGMGKTEEGISEQISDYFALSGRKTLLVNFSEKSDEKIDFEKLLKECSAENPKKLIALEISRTEIQKILPNKEKLETLGKHFDRIVLNASYAPDGLLTCLCLVSDCYILAVHQPKVTGKEVIKAVRELDSPEKAIGAVICKPDKAYVG